MSEACCTKEYWQECQIKDARRLVKLSEGLDMEKVGYEESKEINDAMAKVSSLLGKYQVI
jgi:hypothetical protein